MPKELGLIEKLMLLRRGTQDASFAGTFQDYDTSVFYPSVLLYPDERMEYKKSSSPKRAFSATSYPVIVSAFIQTELADFSNERDALIDQHVVLIRTYPGGIKLRPCAEALATLLANYRALEEDLWEINTWFDTRKRILDEECMVRFEGNPEDQMSHIKILYDQRKAELDEEKERLIAKRKRQLSLVLAQAEAVCMRMEKRLQKLYTHKILRINYYYEVAQRRQPFLPARMATPTVLSEKYDIPVLGSLSNVQNSIREMIKNNQEAK